MTSAENADDQGSTLSMPDATGPAPEACTAALPVGVDVPNCGEAGPPAPLPPDELVDTEPSDAATDFEGGEVEGTFGIRKWWRSHLHSAKHWFEAGAQDLSDKAEEAINRIRAHGTAQHQAKSNGCPSAATEARHAEQSDNDAGGGKVAGQAAKDAWADSIKHMQQQTAEALNHAVRTGTETGRKLADVWDVRDLFEDVTEQKERWERRRELRSKRSLQGGELKKQDSAGEKAPRPQSHGEGPPQTTGTTAAQ